jgi:hypothetical protein
MSFLSGAKAKGAVSNARPAPATANKPAKLERKAPNAGRYSGLGASSPRLPFLRDGRYRVRVEKTYDFDGRSQDWFRAKLEILAASEGSFHKVGEKVIYSQCVTKGDALAVGGPKVVSFTLTALGYETEADFRAAFPEGSQAAEDMMNRVSGADIECEEIGPNPLGGACLLVQATGTGKEDPKTGTEYQEYAWYPDEPEAG